MTPLEELIAGASGDGVLVATLLRKTKVVAARLRNVTLEVWVDHELNGYPDDIDLPEYRAKHYAEVKGHFSGPFGSGLQNALIPPSAFPADMQDGFLFHNAWRQPIAEIERLAALEGPLTSDWSADSVAYTNMLIRSGEVKLYPSMGLQQAFQLISPHRLAAVVDQVRTRILELALRLEELNPAAGQPNAAADPDRVEQVVMNIIGGTHTIAVASRDVHQQVVVLTPGDREQLLEHLASAGLGQQQLEELNEALDADAAAGESEVGQRIGSRALAWTGGIATKAVETGATSLAVAAAKALAQHFGVG